MNNEVYESENKAPQSKFPPMSLASIGLAVLCVILPFFNWLRVPLAAGLYSMFGMSEESAGHSLFGYIFAGSTYQDDTMVLIMTCLALFALIGIILNVVYIVKALTNKEKRFKYGTMGAVIINIMSVLFIVIVGLSSWLLKVMELTAVPYITWAVTIVNLVLIKRLKKQSI